MNKYWKKCIEYSLHLELKSAVCGGQQYTPIGVCTESNIESAIREHKKGYLMATSGNAFDDTCYYWIDLESGMQGGYFVKIGIK